MGLCCELTTTPWYVAGMYPLVQFFAPLIGPPVGSSMTTKPGKSGLRVPSP